MGFKDLLIKVKDGAEDSLAKRRKRIREDKEACAEQEKMSRQAYQKEKVIIDYQRRLHREQEKLKREIQRDREREDASKK